MMDRLAPYSSGGTAWLSWLRASSQVLQVHCQLGRDCRNTQRLYLRIEGILCVQFVHQRFSLRRVAGNGISQTGFEFDRLTLGTKFESGSRRLLCCAKVAESGFARRLVLPTRLLPGQGCRCARQSQSPSQSNCAALATCPVYASVSDSNDNPQVSTGGFVANHCNCSAVVAESDAMKPSA